MTDMLRCLATVEEYVDMFWGFAMALDVRKDGRSVAMSVARAFVARSLHCYARAVDDGRRASK